jgi:hypothetical protein
MQEFNYLINLLQKATPFCFVRFNDGEMKGVRKAGVTVARGDQKVDELLHKKLQDALKFRSHNYWIGKPCSKCFGGLRKVYENYVEDDYPYQTYAVSLINNGRWLQSYDAICSIKRPVYWIGGESQDLTRLSNRGVRIKKQFRVSEKNGWKSFDELSGLDFPSKSVIMLSCGPMSRVLAHLYWKRQEGEITVLDIGSLIDPVTRGVWFGCHTHKRKLGTCGRKVCKECNWRTEDSRLLKAGNNKKAILELV